MAITYHAGRRIQGLSKSTTVANTKPISSQTTNVIDLAVKPDGTEIYVATEDTGKVITYELATAGDVSTAVYNSSKDYTHSLTNPKGMDWNNDGTKIYLASFNTEKVHTYTVSTAYNLSSTVTQVGTGDDLSGIDGAQALQWSHDGAYLFQADNSGVIFRYQVSSAFVVSDGTRTSFNPSETTAVTGISFGDNGKEMYIVSHANTGLFKYTLSTAYDLSTATHDSTLTTTDADNQGIATSNGKIYVLGQTTDIVTDYNNDIKPSNVQVGSRFEETNIRKMYYYNSASFASGTPNLATSTITLGDGGTYGGTAASKQGNDSTAFTLTAKGGGAGSGYQPTSLSEGGSGGGDSASENPPPENHWAGIQPTQSGDSGTYGYGKAGGTSAYNSNTYINSGGAGGSFEIGQDTVNSADSARGGDGLGGTNNTIINQFLIDSSAGVQDGSTGYYYIAGGGGGGNVRAAGTAGAGGKGGGGNGCIDSGSSAGDGVANTGSGGGGGGNNVTHEGNGGKGVCIVKYRTSEITATGGNNTYVVGDYTYRKFTSSGTLTVNSGTGKYDVLLIAGGGAGNDGAGGAGGVVFRNGLQINSWEELGT